MAGCVGKAGAALGQISVVDGCRVRVSGAGAAIPAPPRDSRQEVDLARGQTIISGRGSHGFNLAFSQDVNTPCRVESVQAAACPTWQRLTEGEEPITQDR